MPKYREGPKRGQRMETNNKKRRQDIESAMNTKVCPTCGRKVSASNQGGASVGGGA